MAVEIKIPEAGESISEVHIAQWHKAEGDHVDVDEPVVEVESDKASMDVSAPAEGTLSRILKKDGDTAEPGEVIAYVEETSAADKEEKKPDRPEKEKASRRKQEVAAKGGRKSKSGDANSQQNRDAGSARDDEETEEQEHEEQPKKEKTAKTKKAAEKTESDEPDDEEGDQDRPQRQKQPVPETVDVQPRVMPDAHRALSEHDLSPADVEGTGPGGRILKEDVLRAVDAHNGKPQARRRSDEPRKRSDEERREDAEPMSPLRKTIATRLVQAQQQAALLTTFNEVDMSAVKRLRAEYGDAFHERHRVKLGIMSFFITATVKALQDYPRLNAKVKDDEIIYRRYCDVGVAVATDHGLVVPVLRDADRMSVAELEAGIADLAHRARSKKLAVDELRGGTFTITNGGVYGSLMSTPIVNPPQSGILGLHAIHDRPIAIDGQVEIRPMMYVALTYDHRVVDGREAVLFLNRIKECVESPWRITLDL